MVHGKLWPERTSTHQHTMQDGWMDGMWTGNISLTHSCPTTNQGIFSYVLTIHMYLVSTYLVPTKCFRFLPTYIVTIYFVYSLMILLT
jgi:hypothetical protein